MYGMESSNNPKWCNLRQGVSFKESDNKNCCVKQSMFRALIFIYKYLSWLWSAPQQVLNYTMEEVDQDLIKY